MNILIISGKPETSTHKQTLATVKNSIKKSHSCIVQQRQTLIPSHLKGKDMVISVGGDGTFISALHKANGKIPVLGINADPKHKEGFLLSLPKKNLGKELTSICEGNYSIKQIPTLELLINKKRIPIFAVNEFFVGSSKSYCTFRYGIQRKKKRETQRSSGVIVATSLGAHAWLYSAQGKKTGIPSTKAAYVVREPYEGRVFNYSIKQGVLSKKDKITIIPHMKRSIAIADSRSKEIQLKPYDRVEIKLSSKTVPVVSL